MMTYRVKKRQFIISQTW